MTPATDSFALGFAQGARSHSALVRECLQQLGAGLAGRLGFIYVTDALAAHLSAILDELSTATGIEHWVGATGYGICAGAVEVYQEPALVVMCADLPADAFRVFPGNWQSMDGFRDAHESWFGDRDAVLAQVHGSPGGELVEKHIEVLARVLPAGFLAGGLASAESGEALQIADGIESKGLSGVLLDLEQVPLRVRHSQGCHPIGSRHLISEAFRNVLVKLDGRPALEVLKQDMGELLSRDLERTLPTILAGLMIEGSDTGDYLARHLVGVDQDRGLIGVGDWVAPGGSLVFCRRDPEAARLDLIRMLDELTAGLDRPPRGAVYAACVGRGRHLFGGESVEMGIISEHLGTDVPVAGFFANGEVYHQRLYGYTGVLTLFL